MLKIIGLLFLCCNAYGSENIWDTENYKAGKVSFDTDWDENVNKAFVKVVPDTESNGVYVYFTSSQKTLLGFENSPKNPQEEVKLNSLKSQWEKLDDIVQVIDGQFLCKNLKESNIISFIKSDKEEFYTIFASTYIQCGSLANGFPIAIHLQKLYPNIEEVVINTEPVNNNIIKKNDKSVVVELDFSFDPSIPE